MPRADGAASAPRWANSSTGDGGEGKRLELLIERV
jgi:hypothetical protein